MLVNLIAHFTGSPPKLATPLLTPSTVTIGPAQTSPPVLATGTDQFGAPIAVSIGAVTGAPSGFTVTKIGTDKLTITGPASGPAADITLAVDVV